MSSPSIRPAELRVPHHLGGQGLVESLLVLSDVHLGNDLNDLTPTEGRPKRSRDVDEDLVQLLDHYRTAPSRSGRWRLVIAGDFIDFIGITVRPGGDAVHTPLGEEEEAHGLGNAADHACIKLRRVALRHPNVFAALARFVAYGHTLTLVHGNHDLELHWDDVQHDFRRILLEHAQAQSDAVDAATFDARIAFHPWFFYVDGVVYIEHGHQYDEYCATDHVMAPLSPFDPRRVMRGFSDVLIRYVVRPTIGLREHGHESMGIVDYLAFGARLGLRGMLALGVRFGRAVIELFRLRREHVAEAAAALKAEHERRVHLLATATRIGLERLRSLAALQAPPVTRSIRGILASVLLDRLALALVSILLLVVAGALGALRGHGWWFVASILVGWALAHRLLSRGRNIDPADVLNERAVHLAKLFPAAFVVMGHTHEPRCVPVQGVASTYINVGSWAEEEAEVDDSGAKKASYRAARTHLVIEQGESGPVADFLAWDRKAGPRRFVTGT